MMQRIRDKAQGFGAWIIVGIVAFVLCFWGVSGYINNGPSSVLAKVNGREITSGEVNDIYDRWLRSAATQKGFDMSQIDAISIKRQITIALAQQAATIKGLKKDGMTVSDAMVVQTIRSKSELQQDDKFSVDLYKKLLAQSGMSEAEFETLIRDQLLVHQLQVAVLASSFATPKEAERIIGLKNQTRDFGYSIITADKFIKNVKVTDEQIEEFYTTHKQQFVVPDKVQVEYIELSLESLFKQIPVTDQALQEYYKANQQSFIEPRKYRVSHIMILAPEISDAAQSGSAQKQMEDIYAQLQKGGNFASLAKKYSEDKLSANKGGDLGWTTQNDEYPAAVFALQKNGEFTKPIQTEYGWHIFQLADSSGGGVKSFAAVKPTLVERYKRDAAEKIFSAKGDELANIAFENPTSLGAASEKLNMPIQTSSYFTRQGGSGIAESPNVIKAAFSEDVFANNHNSDLVRVSDDTYVILRVKDKQLSHEMSLADARKDIITYIQRTAARDEAKHIGEELLTAIKETNNPNKAASAQSLEWITKRNVERDSKDVSSELLQRIFVMPKPVDGQAFAASGFTLPNGDYVVVAITKVKNGMLQNTAESSLLEMVSKQIANHEAQIDFASVQEALIAQAKIKYY